MTRTRSFEAIALGESVWVMRVVSHDYIEFFAAILGDDNPTHLDEASAKGGPFKGIVARGT